jgi:hypothetical protein
MVDLKERKRFHLIMKMGSNDMTRLYIFLHRGLSRGALFVMIKGLLIFFVLAGLDACSNTPADPVTQAQRNAASQKAIARDNGGFQGAQPLPLDYENRIAPYSH